MHIEKEEKAGIHAYVSKDLAITNLGFFLTLIFTLTRNNLFLVTVNNSLYIKKRNICNKCVHAHIDKRKLHNHFKFRMFTRSTLAINVFTYYFLIGK